MKNTFGLLRMAMLAVVAGLTSSPAYALESATTGSQATQATVGVINSKVDTTNAIMNNVLACNAVRKFYAPTDPNKDASGCVGIQDYQLTMNTPNGIIANSDNSNWAGEFVGGALGYGVYASSPQIAMYAVNSGSTNWTAVVHAQASPYGLIIDNNSNTAQLCLNGHCVTSLASGGWSFGGMFGLAGSSDSPNPFTGGYSCPGGYNGSSVGSWNGRSGDWHSANYCWK